MIYFIRHGESEANLRNVFAGQKDDALLTDKGRDQAKTTGQNIKNSGLKIDKIIFSPLKRTTETAKIIADELSFDVSKMTSDARIIEYDMGSLTGKTLEKISSARLTAAENAEDPQLFHDRILSCLKELSSFSENILLVSSAGVGRMIEIIRIHGDVKKFYDLPAHPNGSVTKLDWLENF
ncbi:MAG: histidine phosphatase family protein [Patescibacteria group bacterium]